jgi:hypothetical protein
MGTDNERNFRRQLEEGLANHVNSESQITRLRLKDYGAQTANGADKGETSKKQKETSDQDSKQKITKRTKGCSL